MNEFNSFERRLAGILSSTPSIKRYLKLFYQIINYIIFHQRIKFKSKYQVKIVEDQGYETFFGYYDKSPENATGSYKIFHKTKNRTSKKPKAGHSVQIILKSIKDETVTVIGESQSFNWQQGTKLQWLTDDKFIYNFYDSINKKFRARVVDISNLNKKRIIDFPIYDCYKDKFGISLNYSRLAKLRPDYGYKNIMNSINLTDTSNDGIYYVNLESNSSHLLISLESIINLSPTASMKGALHKVNHIMISPDGEYFIFLHRWKQKRGNKHDRLLVSNIHGDKLKILADEGMVSHCCWYGNDRIIGFLRHNSFGDSFYTINIDDGRPELLSKSLLNFGDGHPSVNRGKLLFDTYPDRSRLKHLYIYDIAEDTVEEIGAFYEPLSFFSETRCDLHPRWTANGNNIYIDSAHNGTRQLFLIEYKR